MSSKRNSRKQYSSLSLLLITQCIPAYFKVSDHSNVVMIEMKTKVSRDFSVFMFSWPLLLVEKFSVSVPIAVVILYWSTWTLEYYCIYIPQKGTSISDKTPSNPFHFYLILVILSYVIFFKQMKDISQDCRVLIRFWLKV